MEYCRFGDTYTVRLDKGEEIVTSLLMLQEKEQLSFASVQGLGATDAFTVGVFQTTEKKFIGTDYHGDHEIVSLAGSLDRKDGQCYAHLHMSAAESGTNQVVGGHLIRARISATAELFVRVLPGTAERRFDEETGLNLWNFAKEKN